RHLDDFGTDVDELTATLLLCSTTALANGERDLVARSARILGALEHLTAKKQDGRIVIERLDFPHGPPPGGFEPLLLGGRGRDASQLAREREADGTALQVTRGFRQLFESLRNAELFLTEAGAVAEKTLGVFVERRVAEVQVGSRTVSSEEPASFLEIETR